MNYAIRPKNVMMRVRVRTIPVRQFLVGTLLTIVISARATANSSLAVAASAPTGNNGSVATLPAQFLALAAKESIDSARSVQLVGTVKQVTTTYDIDVTLLANGDSSGTIDVYGTVAHVIIVGQWYYIKGSAEFWTKTFKPAPGNAAKFASVWVAVPRSSITGLGANLTMTHLREGFNLGTSVQLTNIGVSQVTHQRAVGILIAGKGKLWIEATGPYRPAEFVGTNNGNIVHLQFSDWGKGVVPAVPSGLIQYT